jgi:hypothetical protein
MIDIGEGFGREDAIEKFLNRGLPSKGLNQQEEE